MDAGRSFPTPALPVQKDFLDEAHEMGGMRSYTADEYCAAARDLADRCFRHHESEEVSMYGKNPRYGSLYSGGLGPCTYLRLRLAMHHRSLGTDRDREEANSLLRDGIQATESALHGRSASAGVSVRSNRNPPPCCTLLEGRSSGALAMQCALLHAMDREDEAQMAAEDLLTLGRQNERGISPVQSLHERECEVMYGRAGYLHTILFVRSHLSNPTFGQDVVPDVLRTIISTGLFTAKENGGSTGLPLLWECHRERYLGAAHGVGGVLFTLLHFLPELRTMGFQMDRDIVGLVRRSVDQLDGMCFPSGNLPSSTDTVEGDDILVQWCHGAPGHILLLAKAADVFGDIEYLNRAERIARDVIFNRGLLRKGVGLCHGIAGNAYAFLAVHRARRNISERANEESSSNIINDEFLLMAQHFANFAIHKLPDLAHVPDRPYSLYGGVGGLAAFLLDLYDPEKSRFPCFEF